jgi:Transcriptional regulatory protein, C terminal/WD40-like Beta Propeller Repeat
VLLALLENPGELVGRDELRARLWDGEVSGDFEQGLNRAVNRVRQVLCDSATRPRYIETLPGRGYRFVGEVEPAAQATVVKAPRRRQALAIWVAAVAVAAMAFGLWQSWPAAVPVLRSRRLTTDNYNKMPPALSDGTRIYFLASRAGEQFLAQIPAKGGEPTKLPITLPGPSCNLQDLSPDGQEILLTAGAPIDRKPTLPLWTLQIGDGTARRVGTVPAISAAYSQNGEVAFVTESEVWVVPRRGSARRVVELKDSVLGAVYWEPKGQIIRFSRRNPLSSNSSAWEIREDGTNLRPVRPEWQATGREPLGWTPDKRLELFAAEGGFWIAAKGWPAFRQVDSPPIRATGDEQEFLDRARVPSSVSFPAIGIDRLGELQRFDTSTKQWLPLLDGISAEAAEYSRDGRRVVYVSYPQQTLWVREADGKRPIQLTSPPMAAGYPHWSPDGKEVLFDAQETPTQPTKLYVVDSDGGGVRPAVPRDAGSQGDATWSPDGKKLLFGLNGRSTRESVYIRMAEPETLSVTKFPGSEGMFGPRWSPDGKMVVALEWEGRRRLMLYRFETHSWTPIWQERADWPTWNLDSKSLVFRANDALVRLRVDQRGAEPVAAINGAELGGFSHAIGIAPDGSSTRTLNRDSRQVYELIFERR